MSKYALLGDSVISKRQMCLRFFLDREYLLLLYVFMRQTIERDYKSKHKQSVQCSTTTIMLGLCVLCYVVLCCVGCNDQRGGLLGAGVWLCSAGATTACLLL